LLATIFSFPRIVAGIRAPRVKNSTLYYFLKSLPDEALIFAMAKTPSSLIKKRIMFYLSTLCKVNIQVDGDDLKKMGYLPSPRFAQILEEVKKARLDGALCTKEDEIKFIREKFPPEKKR
ncbi:hypothetical protein H5U35_00415, partial [Candidatus Aerophobetes bacterium]|nr:hypothetical protein [Candidatus Aerophobetes bacterium]